MWKISTKPVCDAFEVHLQAIAAWYRAEKNGEQDPETGQTVTEAAAAYYQSIGATLRAFNSASNWRRDDTPKEALPRQIAFFAGQLVDDLLDGRIGRDIAQLFFIRGRPGLGAAQQNAIEAAVRYIAAAQSGSIDDHQPIDRVADAFGVEPRTVRRWKEKNVVTADLVHCFDPALSEELQEMLTRHMLEQATLYRRRRHVKR